MLKVWLQTAIMLSLISGLSGCATTGYQALGGFGGGYTDTRLDTNTARVTYYGSLGVPEETVQNYLLYRCAQVTLKYGYDYFVLITSSTRPVVSSYTSPGMVNFYSNKQGTAGYAYAVPGQTTYYSRDIASAIIKMYTGTKPASLVNAFSARDIQTFLKPAKNE